ncbi:hypothetical protein OTK59_12280 [Vibrio natriegens]|uniref:hypothetical protein n=1 Tax=Vibrio natriegens TaxID=691 RepID=UPI0022842CD5|nr:hypothetical protein [Vibrio natriegens]MCY9877333.1 hypothetical protein [Vibrio natriegens]
MNIEQLRKQIDDELKETGIKLVRKNETKVVAFFDQLNLEPQPEELKYSHHMGLYFECSGIIEKLLKDSELHQDKDGLYLISDLIKHTRITAEEGYFFCKNIAISVHQAYRLSESPLNPFKSQFLEKFWGLEHNGLDTYLALDMDRARVNIQGYKSSVKDWWFGVNFDQDIAKIKDASSKLAPPSDIECAILFDDVVSLDTQWTTKGSIKTFQALEFKSKRVTVSIDGVEKYPARYIHAEYDLDKSAITHCDGAIQYFTEDEYESRVHAGFNHDKKSDQQVKGAYQKIFKVNGCLDTAIWVELVSNFFGGDPLIIEYLTGELPMKTQIAIENMRKNS